MQFNPERDDGQPRSVPMPRAAFCLHARDRGDPVPSQGFHPGDGPFPMDASADFLVHRFHAGPLELRLIPALWRFCSFERWQHEKADRK